MPQNTSLRADSIVISPQLQARDGIDQDHVADIAEAVRKRKPIKRARVILIEDPEDTEHDGKFFAIDQHRILGYKLAGRAEVPVMKLVGKWPDARDLATSSNTEHKALKRSREAKERAVQMCWEDHPDWTPGRVAKHCDVSPTMATEWMATVPAAVAVPQAQRVGLDGKKRKIAKVKAGKPAKAPDDPERFQPILSAFTNVSRAINDAMNSPGGEKLVEYLTYYKFISHPHRTIVDGDNVTPLPKFNGFPVMGFIVRAAALGGKVLSFEELKAKIEKWKEEKKSFVPTRS